MPKKLRPKSRRQRQAVAPLTQVRRTARSHRRKQTKRKAKSSQGRCPRHQNTLHKNRSQLQEPDSSSPSCRTYKNSEELRSRIRSGIITPIHEQWEKARASSPHREFPPAIAREVDPLRIPSHHPHSSRQPLW